MNPEQNFWHYIESARTHTENGLARFGEKSFFPITLAGLEEAYLSLTKAAMMLIYAKEFAQKKQFERHEDSCATNCIDCEKDYEVVEHDTTGKHNCTCRKKNEKR